MLLVNLALITRNWAHGSPVSLTVGTTPPPGILSPASLPRMSLNGRLEKITDRGEQRAALQCYLARHPDAAEWTPDNPDRPHSASWFTFNVDSVFYFGGYRPY
jgi:Pyridoxamine 5'-phosphate oxidase